METCGEIRELLRLYALRLATAGHYTFPYRTYSAVEPAPPSGRSRRGQRVPAPVPPIKSHQCRQSSQCDPCNSQYDPQSKEDGHLFHRLCSLKREIPYSAQGSPGGSVLAADDPLACSKMINDTLRRSLGDGKEFSGIQPNPPYVPLFATILTDEKLGYCAVESTPSPNTPILMPSGINVFGVDDWVAKLADVA